MADQSGLVEPAQALDDIAAKLTAASYTSRNQDDFSPSLAGGGQQERSLGPSAPEAEEVHQISPLEEVSRLFNKHMDENAQLLNIGKEREIGVLIGNTGAGKSTLSNMLLGVPLAPGPSYSIILQDLSDSRAMEIGAGSQSVTLLPRAFEVGHTVFFDMPGLRDTRGTPQGILVAAFIKRILENATSARIVFVVSRDEITASRGEILKSFLEGVEQMLPDVDVRSLSSLIITKTRSREGEVEIKSLLSEYLGRDILQWENRIAFMSEPEKDHVRPQKDFILEKILAAQSTPIGKVSVEGLHSSTASRDLQALCHQEMSLHAARLLAQRQGVVQALDNSDLEQQTEFLRNFEASLRLRIGNSALLQLVRPLCSIDYDKALMEVVVLANANAEKMRAEIEAEISARKAKEAEDRRLEEERKRQEAERLAQEAEQRRIEEERKRQEAERLARAAEQLRLDALRRQQEAERLADPRNWPKREESRNRVEVSYSEERRGPRDVTRTIGSGWSKRTAWGWRMYTDKLETTITDKRTVATSSTGQQVILSEWAESSRTAPKVVGTSERHVW